MTIKLLARNGNTKVDKTMKATDNSVFAQLSLMPTNELCPSSKAAGCFEACLKTAGLASVYTSVNKARQAKTDYWNTDRQAFLSQLKKELTTLVKYCSKHNKQGIVRLNVLSDIAWEDFDIPQQFPMLQFYDYTKRAKRLTKQLPSNYRLMFSYSNRKQYAKQVELAAPSDAPIAVVFSGKFPKTFLNRPVIDGDASDWVNVNAGRVVVALKAKGQAKNDATGFVVNSDGLIAMA